MKLSVIGCGYLGVVHSAAMAELGHEVIGIDVDASRIASLQAARPPFFEPELPEILASATASGRLTFSTDISDVAGATVHFIAVGTPQIGGGNAADMTYVNEAVRSLLPHLSNGDLVVGKSTVPVGTASRLAGLVEGFGGMLAWNPEFLREGFAVQDTLTPDRLVYGVPPGGDVAVEILNNVYAASISAGTPLVVTDYATAELVKVAANAFLATKISFINAMAEISEVVGADVTQLADAIGLDSRIGRQFLNAGIGFGGGCLPKDIRAFMARAEELGQSESVAFLKEVDAINLRRRERVVDLTLDALGSQPVGKRVALLGLAFKPNSDDVRDSPALDVAAKLHERGITVVATDPQAIDNASRVLPQLQYVTSPKEALAGADVVVLATEWAEYRSLDPTLSAELVNSSIIIDGRNTLDPTAWKAAGWSYTGLGRGSNNAGTTAIEELEATPS
jgi:UDPglucose 6-dehydrogenase